MGENSNDILLTLCGMLSLDLAGGHSQKRYVKVRFMLATGKSKIIALFFGACLFWSAFPVCFGASAENLPSASSVLKALIERASKVAQDEKSQKFCYSKLSITEELDSRGRVISSTEKKYDVTLIQGWAFDHLVQVQGRQLSETERQKEEQREEEFRNRVAGGNVKLRKDRKEAWLTPELLSRYHFTVLSNDVCQHRPALVLSFKPKPGNVEKTIEDRICNRFAGLLWVDKEDSEIARLDVHLTSDLSLGWLGMIGSLKYCSLNLQRQKMPQGPWVNSKHVINIVGRKLFSSMRFRAIEQSSEFRPAT